MCVKVVWQVITIKFLLSFILFSKMFTLITQYLLN